MNSATFEMDAIYRAAKISASLNESVRRTPSRYIRFLPPQDAFARSTAKFRLLRLGNQWGGKTTVSLAIVDWHCTGKHPYQKVRPPPIEAWIVCRTWSQSVSIQAKFWALCDKTEIDPGTRFDPVKGFIGKNPCIKYRNGSVVRFKTSQQGALDLAGATIDFVLIDEPTSEAVYSELKKRLLRRNGTMLISLTPLGQECGYLQKEVEAGIIEDHHYPLRPEYLIPIGSDYPLLTEGGIPMDAEWCQRLRDTTLIDAGIRIDGEWETKSLERRFTAFNDSMIVDRFPELELTFSLGIDHGMKAWKQVAILVGVDNADKLHPKVFVLDEYCPDANSTSEFDAIGIVRMLTRWGLRWEDLDFAVGDRAYDARRYGGARKSNIELEYYIGQQIGYKPEPPLREAKRGSGGNDGSVDAGFRWLHKTMLRPGEFFINSKCHRLIEALRKWNGKDNDEKDPIDALRYAVWNYAIRQNPFSSRNKLP